MKYYPLDGIKDSEYIISYKMDGNRVIVKYADGSYREFGFTYGVENLILSRMEDQARSIIENMEPLPPEIKRAAKFWPLALPFSLIWCIIKGGNKYSIIIATIVASLAIHYPAQILLHKADEKDVKKMKYYLQNKNTLNNHAYKVYQLIQENNLSNFKLNIANIIKCCLGKMLGTNRMGLSRSAIRQLKIRSRECRKAFDMNNLDKYSISDINAMLHNIHSRFYNGHDNDPDYIYSKKL